MKPIQISDKFYKKAADRSEIDQRTPDAQVEYWATMGQLAEDHPELSFYAIKDILIGTYQVEHKEVEPYIFGEGKRKKYAATTNQAIRTAEETATA